MKKRVLSLILVLILNFGFSACGQKGGEAGKVTVTFPEVSTQRNAAEKAGAFAVEQYLYARLKTEALLEYDLESGSPDALSVMVEETLEAWRVAEAAASGTEQIASASESPAVSPTAATVSYADSRKAFHPFVMAAYAAEENAASAWARELTEKFDSYPANARIKSLAQELGVDARSAYEQLQTAQAILRGEADREGDYNQLIENALLATKAACKVGLYVGGAVASGGVLTGAAEVAGFLVGGVDVMVELQATGSKIIFGDRSCVTIGANKLKDVLAPITAVTGIFTFNTGNAAEQLSYIGDSIIELYQDKTILGGLFSFKRDGSPDTMTAVEIETEGKSVEEVEKELKHAGLPVPSMQEPARTYAEAAAELEDNMGCVLTPEDVQDYFGKLMTALEQPPETDPSPSEPEPEPPQSEPAQSEPAQSEPAAPVTGDAPVGVAGTYNMTTVKEDGLTDSFPATVLLHEDGTMEITFTPHRVVVNDDFTFSVDRTSPGITEHLVGKYDAGTGTFTGMGDSGIQDDAWNWASTVLTFDTQASTASGRLGGELKGLAALSFTTQITMEKIA